MSPIVILVLSVTGAQIVGIASALASTWAESWSARPHDLPAPDVLPTSVAFEYRGQRTTQPLSISDPAPRS